MDIIVEHNPDRAQLDARGVFEWPVWEKGVSRFDWTYATRETCYITAGTVTVTPDNGAPVRLAVGDYVIFPAGMKCVWDITDPISKHYQFE